MEADLKREYHGITGLNSLYRRLLAKQFTAIADLHSVLRSSYLRMRFNLDHYKVAHIDKHRKDRRRITSSSNKQLIQLPTSFQNYADVFARLGYPVNVQFRSIFSEDGGDMNLLPESLPRPTVGQPCIGIAPFAAHEGKIYPVRLMEQVVEQLIDSIIVESHDILFDAIVGRIVADYDFHTYPFLAAHTVYSTLC